MHECAGTEHHISISSIGYAAGRESSGNNITASTPSKAPHRCGSHVEREEVALGAVHVPTKSDLLGKDGRHGVQLQQKQQVGLLDGMAWQQTGMTDAVHDITLGSVECD